MKAATKRQIFLKKPIPESMCKKAIGIISKVTNGSKIVRGIINNKTIKYWFSLFKNFEFNYLIKGLVIFKKV